MKAILLVLLLTLTPKIAGAVISGMAPEPMPEVLFNPEEVGEYPVFVGLEKVLTPDGKVDPGLFPPTEAMAGGNLVQFPACARYCRSSSLSP